MLSPDVQMIATARPRLRARRRWLLIRGFFTYFTLPFLLSFSTLEFASSNPFIGPGGGG